MNRYIRTFLFILTVIFSSINSLTALDFNYSEKIYIQRDDVMITDEGILISYNDELYPVHTLSCDEMGLYVDGIEGWKIKPKDIWWQCQKCGEFNLKLRKHCSKCKEPRE